MDSCGHEYRTGWALLATGALIASLLAVGATPAAAIDEDSKPDHPAGATACLGPALADAGFTDTGGLGAEADINCLAYYGITTGKTADTFDPGSNVTRSQMALFLYRAAGLMGVDLMGGDMMASYGDIADQGPERSNAITALARNGILTGRSSMAFEPNADITRAEMAVALVALLDKTPGVALSKPTMGANAGLYVLGAAPGALPNDSFTDARRQTPRHIDNAISAAYELGITTGRPAGSDTFAPHDPVPRKNMASFIVRALAHSNLRPAGLTAQVSDTTITVSVRDASFAPVINQTVDAFRAAVAFESKAFKDDGTCSSRTFPFEGAPTKCQIDGADPVTQSDGNVELTLDGAVGDGQTVWIWAGDLGDKVSSSTDLVEVSIEKGAATPPPVSAAVLSTDLPKQPNAATPTDVTRAKFGATVTITIQLQGDPDGSGPLGNVNTVPTAGQDPPKYTVAVRRFDGTDNTGTLHSRLEDQTVTIGADGSGSFTITGIDTDPRNRGQTQAVEYTVTAGTGAIAATGSPGLVIFSDEAPAVTYVTVKGNGPQVAPGAGGAAGNRVTVTVLDQFGSPVSNAPVVLKSNNPVDRANNDNDGADIRTRALNTRASGSVTFGYSYTGGASRETLVAMWDGYLPEIDQDGDGDLTDDGDRAAVGTSGTAAVAADGTYACQDSGAAGADVCGDTTVDWVNASQAESGSTLSVLSIDVDNDQIVVDLATGGAVTPTSVNYDGGDYFTIVSSASGSAVSSPAGLADFEAAVVADLEAAAGTTASDQPTLTWTSYVHDDVADIATFTLTLGGSR